MRSRLDTLSPEDRRKKSLKIQEKLFKLDAFRTARTVCFYVGTDKEIDTVPMIEESIRGGKRVLLPRVNLENKELKLFEIKNVRTELSPGALGILEPDPAKTRAASPSDIDCIVVPGLAFDTSNRRLGRGAGFYDRFLERLHSDTFKVALAFSFQVFPEIPHEPHDRSMDAVLTED